MGARRSCGQFSIQLIIWLVFVLSFLLLFLIWWENAEGEFWLIRGRLFLAKTLRTIFFVLVSTVIPPQLSCCAREEE